jgi:hypothetical protein
MHEVERPSRKPLRGFGELVRQNKHRQRRAGADRAPPRLALAHRQPFLGVEPLRPFAVHLHTVPQQQDVQPPVAKTPTLPGQLAQPPAQRGVVAMSAATPNRRPIRPDHAARPPLAHPEADPEMRDFSRKRFAFRRLRAWRRASPLMGWSAPALMQHRRQATDQPRGAHGHGGNRH